MDHLKSLWRGDYALIKTYWLYAVLGNCLVNFPLIVLGAVDKDTASYPPQEAVYILVYTALRLYISDSLVWPYGVPLRNTQALLGGPH